MTDEQKQKYKITNEQKYKDYQKEYRKNMTDEQKKMKEYQKEYNAKTVK